MTAIKIAIAEDSDLLREAISELVVKKGFDIVATAQNGRQLIEKLKDVRPDIVLMDISMPEMDGIETTKWLNENRKEIKIIALTMMSDDETVMKMVTAGARAFLMKHTSPENLFGTIINVQEQGYSFTSEITAGLVKKAQTADGYTRPPGVYHDKQDEELIIHSSSSLSYREIGEKMNISPRTVENKISELTRRLNVQGRVAMALYAVKHGIIKL